MNSSFSAKSTGSQWFILTSILGFWFSSSLLIDVLVIPSLYLSGMLMEPLFANSGYLLFSIFNRVELLCAAIVLTYLLGLEGMTNRVFMRSRPIGIAILLLGITFVTTYLLTPAMGAMAIDLDLFNPFNVPSSLDMRSLHTSYLGLEITKLLLSIGLLRFCFQHFTD